MKVYLKTNGRLPIYRTINTISVLVQFLTQRGITANSILDGSGITVSDLHDPEKRIKPEQELMIFRRIIKLTPEPEIGLLLGTQYHIGIHGSIGIAAMLSDTAMEATQTTMRYAELTLTYFQYVLAVRGKLACLKMKELIALNELQPFVCEREFVSVYRMFGDVLGAPLPLHEVHIAYPAPAYGSLYSKYFNCPVFFNAREHMFIFNEHILHIRLPKPNPLLKKVYEAECRKLCARLEKCETVTDKIYNEILFHEEGHGSMGKMARLLNVTTRTLRRHLADERTTYQAIISNILKKRAIDLLTTTAFSIEEIAAKLGYSDTPNFYHAFKKWTGTSPAKYRKNK